MIEPASSAPETGRSAQAARRSRFVYAIAGVLAIATGLVAGAVTWLLRDVHFPSTAEITSRRVIVLKSADGHDLLHKGNLRLEPVNARDMPADVVNAVLSIEDRHFYQHGAMDLPSLLRALKQNSQAGKIVAGGSTITQQLVKTLFLGPERTFRRKIEEAAVAIWVERHLSKDEILTSYLNNVYLGSGATGFPAAARLYFNKRVAELSVAEAAMLAGLINAPGHDDPLRDLKAARRRASLVLDAMVENGKLSEQAAIAAKLHPATPSPADMSPESTGWFVDWVYDRAVAVTPALGGTFRIMTTLDLRLQQIAANLVKATLARYGHEKRIGQAALVAMRPDGSVVAMIGGRSYAETQYNRSVQAERQPGSAFKLFDYYAALRHGLGPRDEILDAPIDIHGWQPENYGRRYHGKVTLVEAFAESLNGAAVRLSQQVGIPEIIAAARDLGLRGRLENHPSLALGTSELSLLDLTSAYAAVRAGRAPINPHGIIAFKMSDDRNYLPVESGVSQHSLGPYQTELIELLRAVVERGTGRAAALQGFAAGKTGTSQDYRDAWFIGFDDSLVVGVWVGNDDHSPMMKGVVGGSIPAKMWKEFMEQARAQPIAETSRSESMTVGQAQGAGISDEDRATPASDTEAAQCNVAVCERSYHSFRASDCTYQPYWGPRQACAR